MLFLCPAVWSVKWGLKYSSLKHKMATVCLRIREWRKQFHNSAVESTKPRAVNSGPIAANRGNLCLNILFLKIRLEGLGKGLPFDKKVCFMWAHPLTNMESKNLHSQYSFLKCAQSYSFQFLRNLFYIYIHKTIWLKTSIQLYPALLVLLTSTSVAPHVYCPAWHDTQEKSTGPIHLQRVHKTPPFLLHCPSPILSLPGYNTRLPQQKGDVGAIFKSNSLLHYKKGKGFAMVHSASCMAAWLSGAPMWPWDTEREQGWESLPNPPPSSALWSREAWRGLQSTPAPPPAH